MNTMSKALLLGKFLPFHSGHARMINYAIGCHKQVIVCVFSRGGETWDGELRAQWIRDSYNNPNVEIVHCPMDFCDPYDEDSWAVWTNVLKNIGRDVTHFVSSEDYGDEIARRCGWAHQVYDKSRFNTPISGTEIRKDILGNWKFLPDSVRKSLVKKVAIVGAESTGKTTLCEKMSAEFNTVYVPEYGRKYCEFKDITNLSSRDFISITNEQKILEDRLAVQSNGIMFCDTEMIVTRAWAEHLLGFEPIEIKGIVNSYDLFAVTNVNNNWAQDGTRVCDEQKVREKFQKFILSEINRTNQKYIMLPKNYDQAFHTLTDLLKTIWI